MQFIGNILLKGLATILPVSVTLYLIYWISTSTETLLRSVITNFIPASSYIPGMGLVFGLVLLFMVGLVVNAWIVQHLIAYSERILEKIPLVKSVYGALRDFMQFFSKNEKRINKQKVVMVTIADMRLLGFVTREHVDFISDTADDIIAVYLPMSYQVGGYTVYLPRSSVTPVNLSMEDAMKEILTAGLSKAGKKIKPIQE